MKPDFDKAQDTATRLLLNQNIQSLYIDVRKFALPADYYIESMQNFCAATGLPISELHIKHLDGACLIKQGPVRIILYDDTIANEQRKHWGIVHELGHAFLDHNNDEGVAEIEAHFFAAQIVMPEIVLCNLRSRCGGLNPQIISDTFNASLESSCRRIGTLSRRCWFNSSEPDKQLLSKFRPIIDKEFPPESDKRFWDKLCPA